MPFTITAEHLELNPSLRKRIESSLYKIIALAPRASTLKLFLKRNTKNQYQATLVIQGDQQDLSYTERGQDLLGVILSAKSHLLRRMVDKKKRRLDRRKARLAFQATG